MVPDASETRIIGNSLFIITPFSQCTLVALSLTLEVESCNSNTSFDNPSVFNSAYFPSVITRILKYNYTCIINKMSV